MPIIVCWNLLWSTEAAEDGKISSSAAGYSHAGTAWSRKSRSSILPVVLHIRCAWCRIVRSCRSVLDTLNKYVWECVDLRERFGRYCYFASSRSAKYIAISVFVCLSVCLYVCLFVRSHFSKTACPNFTKFSVHVNRGHGSILLWRQCNIGFCGWRHFFTQWNMAYGV